MDLLAIARLRSPFGLKGFLKLHSYSGDYRHFSSLTEVCVSNGKNKQRLKVEDLQAKANILLIKFGGIDSPERAKDFSNWEVYAERENACPLEEGEYYLADICRCQMIYKNQTVGDIVSIIEGGPNDFIELQLKDGRKCLVPFRREFVGKVDIEALTVELLEDWILE